MAQIIFTAAATAVAEAGIVSGVAATAVKLGASVAGQVVDGQLQGAHYREGPRIDTLEVQSSTYGRMIPIVYGTMRLAGNIIWSTPVKEEAVTSRQRSGGKGGGGATTQRTDYRYSINIAIALAEGPIDSVTRIWANNQLLDISSEHYRLYKGDETQLPDPLMEAIKGVGKVPAYRGLAYIVFEAFPLEEFGNRVPNFTFEVVKRHAYTQNMPKSAEQLVESMVMIPGSGEFVYDTIIQQKQSASMHNNTVIAQGFKERINHHNHTQEADAVLALNQLQDTCPNIKWIAPVVTWFANSLKASSCIIKPGIEQPEPLLTTPDSWKVATYTRRNAHLLSRDKEDRPIYGGTIHDDSLLRYLALLRERGVKIMLYPMFFMDVHRKPWRGRVTGSYNAVASFFTKPYGYNEFILHYAQLVKGKVDAFVIGSELIGLTSIHNTQQQYPAVEALIDLAHKVKQILGKNVVVTYAADWSEYHHTAGGWYHLDPLWACDAIDVVGIDAYFPLTDCKDSSVITKADIKKGWHTGEGFEWIYSDTARTQKEPIAPAYAWKNIRYWWEHHHTNPNGARTPWQPKMKPIWFTEYGFPSVDAASNQPNVFFDPDSSEGFLPRYSKGFIDFQAQRTAIEATEETWNNSDMIQNRFLWTWDARPFPYWPRLKQVWADHILWKTGHWVQGKLGMSSLAAIVADMCKRAGLHDSQIDVSGLDDNVQGFVVPNSMSVRTILALLQRAYFFDVVMHAGVIYFNQYLKSKKKIIEIKEENIVIDEDSNGMSTQYNDRTMLPETYHIHYMDNVRDYQPGQVHSTKEGVVYGQHITITLPIVMEQRQALAIAQNGLHERWQSSVQYHFTCYDKEQRFIPGNVVRITYQQQPLLLRLLRVSSDMLHRHYIQAVPLSNDVSEAEHWQTSEDISVPALHAAPYRGNTIMQLFQLPSLPHHLPGQTMLHIAAAGEEEKWPGAIIYRSLDGGENYDVLTEITQPAIMGSTTSLLKPGAITVIDKLHHIDVQLQQGQLHSVSLLGLYNGANAILIGNELLQFQYAHAITAQQYRLTHLLRARQGTTNAMTQHTIGERVVLLNEHVTEIPLATSLIGVEIHYKAVTIGQALEAATAISFTLI